jgi:poly [ADP-ribose] polymerase
MSDESNREQPEMAPYVIEPARSGRSKCKTCRRGIQKGHTRIGILIVGPFGPGYLWHHMNCAARRQLAKVEEAYEMKVWADGVDVPPIEKLRLLAEKAEKDKAERKTSPHTEKAPTGRAKCKHCGEPIPKDSYRVVLLRGVEFAGQVRSGPINVHPGCVVRELMAEDCTSEPEGFEDALRANSTGVPAEDVERVLAEIGPIPG